MSGGCLCRIHWSQMSSREWRCSWSSADRRCSNYIWMIDNFISYYGASYIRGFTILQNWVPIYSMVDVDHNDEITENIKELTCPNMKSNFLLASVHSLTHWGRDKMAAFSQTKQLSNAFSSMKRFDFWLKIHWSLFLRVQFHQPRLVIRTFHRQGRCSRGGHLCNEHSEEKYSCSYK